MRRVIAGRLAVVTGGARGIGRATAAALLDEGVRVAVADRDPAALGEARTTLARPGREVIPVALDVTDAAAFAQAAAALEREHGPIDLLVNNAGIMSVGPFLEQDPVLDVRQLAVNVGGVIAGLRAVLPSMVARGEGHVINVASVAGRIGTPGVSVYAATKHAVVGLSESVRHELAGTGVDVSWVLPGVVATELTAGVPTLRWPRTIRPEEVADAIVDTFRTRRVEVYVPRAGRLAAVLPALLPRALAEGVGRLLGVDRLFARVDARARAAYDRRLRE
jgi:short-subunit dehydrogenase